MAHVNIAEDIGGTTSTTSAVFTDDTDLTSSIAARSSSLEIGTSPVRTAVPAPALIFNPACVSFCSVSELPAVRCTSTSTMPDAGTLHLPGVLLTDGFFEQSTMVWRSGLSFRRAAL